MKSLTLIRPWDYAILHLGKDVENRSWAPWDSCLDQRIAIHAGMKLDGDAIHWITCTLELDLPPELCSGAIVGTVLLSGWVSPYSHRGLTEQEREAARKSRWRNPDATVQWVLREPIAFREPIPCRGRQGLWTLPPDVEAQVLEQERIARAA